MNEIGFVKAIDDNFSFETDREYEEVARAGCSISDNVALMAGYQPASGASHASPEANLRMLDVFAQERPTPVVPASIPVVRSLLDGEPVALEGTRGLPDACRKHSNAAPITSETRQTLPPPAKV